MAILGPRFPAPMANEESDSGIMSDEQFADLLRKIASNGIPEHLRIPIMSMLRGAGQGAAGQAGEGPASALDYGLSSNKRGKLGFADDPSFAFGSLAPPPLPRQAARDPWSSQDAGNPAQRQRMATAPNRSVDDDPPGPTVDLPPALYDYIFRNYNNLQLLFNPAPVGNSANFPIGGYHEFDPQWLTPSPTSPSPAPFDPSPRQPARGPSRFR